MKTVLVIYSNTALSQTEARSKKRYCFNISNSVKVGDRIDADQYTTPLQVVEILPKSYKYVNISTGEMSNVREPNTNQMPIRTIAITREYEHESIDVVGRIM